MKIWPETWRRSPKQLMKPYLLTGRLTGCVLPVGRYVLLSPTECKKGPLESIVCTAFLIWWVYIQVTADWVTLWHTHQTRENIPQSQLHTVSTKHVIQPGNCSKMVHNVFEIECATDLKKITQHYVTLKRWCVVGHFAWPSDVLSCYIDSSRPCWATKMHLTLWR